MRTVTRTAVGLLALAPLAVAQEMTPDPETLSDSFPAPSYSPYAVGQLPMRPLWGDTHLHTSTSFDAGAFGNRLDARAAYRFAKGEEVTCTTGTRARLSRPSTGWSSRTTPTTWVCSTSSTPGTAASPPTRRGDASTR